MPTKLIGILNITPDSFSDGGRYTVLEHAVAQAEKLVQDGASILDIGAESTRPGATPITHAEEWKRLGEVLKTIKRHLSGTKVRISVDTYHVETARKAIEIGVDIINDVSGCEHAAMQQLIAASEASIIIMHNLGLPARKEHILPEDQDAVATIMAWAKLRLDQLEAQNIKRSRVIIDPGIGFGKNARQSLHILRSIPLLKTLDVPLCIGHSRKSCLAAFSPTPSASKGYETETLAVSLRLSEQGVDYLRVHDVEAHQRALTVFSDI